MDLTVTDKMLVAASVWASEDDQNSISSSSVAASNSSEYLSPSDFIGISSDHSNNRNSHEGNFDKAVL